mmetsp:Transcript_98728/g.235248  ORF Transcript_98728/g.235248 Transcript_98728/m.235248 type:complete len:210 (+) Transcript_98728:1656-2285(+)
MKAHFCLHSQGICLTFAVAHGIEDSLRLYGHCGTSLELASGTVGRAELQQGRGLSFLGLCLPGQVPRSHRRFQSKTVFLFEQGQLGLKQVSCSQGLPVLLLASNCNGLIDYLLCILHIFCPQVDLGQCLQQVYLPAFQEPGRWSTLDFAQRLLSHVRSLPQSPRVHVHRDNGGLRHDLTLEISVPSKCLQSLLRQLQGFISLSHGKVCI